MTNMEGREKREGPILKFKTIVSSDIDNNNKEAAHNYIQTN